MQPIDIVILVAAVLAVGGAVALSVVRKKQGKSGCCDCSSCADCANCPSRKLTEKKD